MRHSMHSICYEYSGGVNKYTTECEQNKAERGSENINKLMCIKTSGDI